MLLSDDDGTRHMTKSRTDSGHWLIYMVCVCIRTIARRQKFCVNRNRATSIQLLVKLFDVFQVGRKRHDAMYEYVFRRFVFVGCFVSWLLAAKTSELPRMNADNGNGKNELNINWSVLQPKQPLCFYSLSVRSCVRDKVNSIRIRLTQSQRPKTITEND